MKSLRLILLTVLALCALPVMSGEREEQRLQHIERTLRRAQEAGEVRGLRTEIERQAESDLADFAQDEQQIQNLPETIKQRHRDAVAEYRRKSAELTDKLKETENAGNAQERRQRAGEAAQVLKRLRAPSLPLNPAQLPFQSAEPRALPQEQADASDTQAVQVASTALLPGLLALAAPNIADLALGQGALSDTPDIRALAQSLEHHPVKIYQWVRDNIVFVPTFGAVQSAQTTLLDGRGNALDTAGLLIALLRASGIHARYAYGDVIIPADKMVNWLGVENTAAAVDLLSRTEMPLTLRIQGGQVVAFKLRNHVWAEAWIDFYPSRGAGPSAGSGTGQGDTWLPLDASFKQYQDIAGTDLSQAVPFDTATFRSQLLFAMQGDANWAGGVDLNYIESQLTGYQAQLRAYTDTHQTHPAKRRIISENRSVLAAGLPYQVSMRNGQFGTIPGNLSHFVTFSLYANATEQSLDNPLFSQVLSLDEIDQARLNLTYEPATPEDAQALQSFQQQGGTSLPVYLFRLKPVLKLDEKILAEGPAVGMGQAQYFSLGMSDPDNRYSKNGVLAVGDELVFVPDGNGVSAQRVQRRMALVDPNSPAENLYLTGLHFWLESDLFDEIAARAYKTHAQRLPSIGVFNAPLTVDYRLGIPRAGWYGTRRMDVWHSRLAVQAKDQASRLNYLTQAGLQGSYLEGNIFDQLFGQGSVPGLSTTQILLEAAQRNLPIYRIDAQNLSAVLPQLNIGQDVEDDIVAAVNAGKQVIIPQAEMQLGSWFGTGYIAQDLQTGYGAYMISGGWNGGTWAGCWKLEMPPVNPLSPDSFILQQIIAQAFQEFLEQSMNLIDEFVGGMIDDVTYQARLIILGDAFASTVISQATGKLVSTKGCPFARVRISRDGKEVTGRLQNKDEYVGKHIILTAEIDKIPDGVDTSKIKKQWIIQYTSAPDIRAIKKYELQFIQAGSPTHATLSTLTQNDLTMPDGLKNGGDKIDFYWVESVEKEKVVYSVNIGGKICEAYVPFTVKKPKIEVKVTINNPNDPIELLQPDPVTNKINYTFGRRNAPPGDHYGIVFDPSVIADYPDQSYLEWGQLVKEHKRYHDVNGCWYRGDAASTRGSYVLDSKYPIKRDQYDVNVAPMFRVGDAPGSGIKITNHALGFEEKRDFIMYPMFRFDMAADTIPVPLASIEWGYHVRFMNDQTVIPSTWKFDNTNRSSRATVTLPYSLPYVYSNQPQYKNIPFPTWNDSIWSTFLHPQQQSYPQIWIGDGDYPQPLSTITNPVTCPIQ